MEDSIIARIPLFEGMSPEEQDELRAMMTQTTLRRGETLFNEGDAGDRLYILLAGKVKLGHASADGRENLLAVLGPGEVVGELTLFDPGPRSTTATAVAPTELLTLEHSQLMGFIESHPTLAKDSDCAAPTPRWPTWSSPTFPAALPRPCWTWPTASARRRRTACTSRTT